MRKEPTMLVLAAAAAFMLAVHMVLVVRAEG